MSPQAIAQALDDRKAGQFVTVFINRKAHLRKQWEMLDIRKISRIQIQLSSYANRAPVKEAIENGTRDAPQLPKHISHITTIGNVRFWVGHNGKIYFPYPLIDTNTSSEYLMNGKPITVDALKAHCYCLASEFPNRPSKESLAERGQVPFVGVSVEHITAIH